MTMETPPYFAAPQAPTPTVTSGGSGQAKASLILGLVGVIAWTIPLVGLPVTIAGIVLGAHGRRSHLRMMATVGLVLSIVFLVLALVNTGWGAYLGATGKHALVNEMLKPN